MPGYDPASMNPGPWITGQARHDSQGSAVTAYFHPSGRL